MTRQKVVTDKYSLECCRKKFEVGELVNDRWGRFVCEDCNDKFLSLMAVYSAGNIPQSTVDAFPELRCGDMIL